MMLAEEYNPRTWRTHALHMLPPEAEEFSWDDPRTKAALDWIFLISSLNFSFWSEKSPSDRYGVRWREPRTSGEKTGERVQVFTGYCSLLAAINRGHSPPPESGFWMISFDVRNPVFSWTALEEDIPFIDPEFYSTCSDGMIAHIFRPAWGAKETMSLLKERIAIMRENGGILVKVKPHS
jgi:hypothetical protein